MCFDIGSLVHTARVDTRACTLAAAQLNAERIGHGLHLFDEKKIKNPDALNMYNDFDIISLDFLRWLPPTTSPTVPCGMVYIMLLDASC